MGEPNISGLSEEQLTELWLNQRGQKEFLTNVRERLAEIVRTAYFRRLTEEEEIIALLRTRAVGRPYATDEAAQSQFIEAAKRSGDGLRITPVFHFVRAGYRAEFHGPLHGPCGNWPWPVAADLRDNPSTPAAVTFFLPAPEALFPSSTATRQLELLQQLSRSSGLAPHLVTGFGPFSMLVGHLLAHWLESGQRPLSNVIVRTDTFWLDRNARLLLSCFAGQELNCFRWDHGDGVCYRDLRCLVLGVQELDPEPVAA